ncbi:MAG: hypothetical protein ACI84R_001385 [Candidatus Azotimanducaceae bacterium]|jgi:hypothetical protein
MTDVSPDSCTAVTILFDGQSHKEAAKAFLIQFSDGGLDEEIEARMKDQGFTVDDTDFSLEKNEITIKLGTSET